jgi:serine/threonine protein kinase
MVTLREFRNYLDETRKECRPEIIREISIMRRIRHPNLLEFIGAYLFHEKLWVHLKPRYCFQWSPPVNTSTFSDVAQVVCEYIGFSLADILDQFEHVKLDESQMAYVCKEVRSSLSLSLSLWLRFSLFLCSNTSLYDVSGLHVMSVLCTA